MPFQPDGSFDREIDGGWQADRDANIKITAVRHDLEDDGFATGLSTCITRDGRSTIIANIPWNGQKITDYAGITGSDAPDTVVNKGYVDNFKDFTTGLEITGAGPINGFLTFKAPTGVNGIGWTTADMSWIGRIAVTNESAKRLAINDAVDGTGNDVFAIDETGRANSLGMFTSNLSYENSLWRTITAGIGTLFSLTGGALEGLANDVATTVAYQTATLRRFFRAWNTDGSVYLELNKSASAKVVGIRGSMADKPRWLSYYGNATVETATDRVGSDFALYSYNNLGTVAFTELVVNRLTHKWSFGGEIYAPLITSAQNFDSTSTICILSATNGGSIRLRPDGPTVATSSFAVDTNGTIAVCEGDVTPSGGVKAGLGVLGKIGSSGNYSASYWINSNWNGSVLTMYANSSVLGNVAWQCDYRIKKDVQPLPSTWEAVKGLRPISYTQREYEVWTEDDTVRWGFMAHELQERLTESAASGVKDGPDVQSPNMMVVIAALTRALQEAQARIEALEAGS